MVVASTRTCAGSAARASARARAVSMGTPPVSAAKPAARTWAACRATTAATAEWTGAGAGRVWSTTKVTSAWPPARSAWS
jgi:hypothetical protein